MVPWVAWLAAPGDTSPPLNPYASLAASLNKIASARCRRRFRRARLRRSTRSGARGRSFLDGQTAPVAFRPWPAFTFKPKAGDRLRYAVVEQWGTRVLWAAPLESADAKP